ncbi:efflux RND transporter permease subunit [bacterium]|nr:efflux RND transporter permease subunit [bacterium]
MNLTKLAITRPFTVAVGFLIAILIGLFSLMRLPVDLMPDISYPTVSVSTTYAGVGPEEIETLLTRPIEEAVSGVQGLEEVTSTSAEGQSQVRLSFRWGTNLQEAIDDVRARLDRIRNRLPDDASAPTIRKFDMAAMPVFFIGMAGDMPAASLKKLADDEVKFRLERLPGVAAVDVRGGLDRQIHVELDRHKLASYKLTIDQVISALGRENLNAPAGDYRQGARETGLRVRGEFKNVQDIADTPIVNRGATPIRVRDVAVVKDSFQDVKRTVYIDGVPSLNIAISKQSGSNTVQVAEAVKREIEAINHDLRGASLYVTNDSSRFISRAIHHIANDLVIGSALAVLVLLFFLRNLRSTLIVATAIPVSVIATFALLYFQNFTLNTMSLGGLALGIGRLLDDSIVVIENIFRHREMGKNPLQAALDGTKQVSLAVAASTFTTLAVFVPLIFLTGMTGVMFKQLSLVVVFALTCSMIVALGLIPMLSSRFLKDEEAPKQPAVRRMYEGIGGFLDGMDRRYAKSLDWALSRGKRVAATIAAVSVASLFLFPMIGSEYMPSSDEGEVRVRVEMAEGTPLDALEAAFQKVEAIVRREVPEALSLQSEIGGGGWGVSANNTGTLNIRLVDRAERQRSNDAIATALRPKLSGIPGVTARASASGGNRMMQMGQTDGSKLGVQIRGYDLKTAQRLAKEVEAAMAGTPGLSDVQAERQGGRPETVLAVDRQKAASLGVTTTQVARALESAMLGSNATMLREAGDEYAVLVRLAPEQRKSLDDALDLKLTSASGAQVALRDAVQVIAGTGPTQIKRENKERVFNVTGEIESKDLGGTVAKLRERLAGISLPSGFALLVTGDFEEQQKSFNELTTALALALLLVFLVMVAQFESLRSPFIIFFSVPACVIGVVLALLLTGTTLNVQSYIGMIVLVGIAVSNGIVMVDFIDQLRKEGVPLAEAVRRGAQVRLRPVLMTSVTTVLAMVPMALGLGEGGELQSPMARVVIGGLITSTGITLYLVPIVYGWLNRKTKVAPQTEAMLTESAV